VKGLIDLRAQLQEHGGIAGAVELADLLGVSRQRVGQLARDHDDFPDPVGTVSGASVWIVAEVLDWQRRRRDRLRKRAARRRVRSGA
jgi:predicted DNA-binding transcriptional regulator AlpA